ncbi:aldo/keto reductase [Franzmannia qiaohouensis]|uniref:Aldo/keto reductase n=1 Tax=Franzmannia qiaohouensis TaxID=1329370 RepID=A0ABU1HJN0_9GAMM|nr:aldo/keto reductase [Halomonas qiaohouensis]MDR5907482.1 aldo/keto reductase [Halomonas qiaohouensis]
MCSDIPHSRLGKSGLFVSKIALGTMTFGARTDPKEAERIFSEATDAGVNFIDTANTYTQGESEKIVGNLIKNSHHDLILATKLGNPNGSGRNRRGLSRRWMVSEVEASLKRLGMDHVDILYLHKEDHETPLEETARALEDLRRAGKIRYYGASNFKAWRIINLLNISNSEGGDGPIVSQPLYHMLNRTAEIEQIPACARNGIGIVTYSPTARGILTGKYKVNEAAPKDSRAAAKDKRMLETEFHPANIETAEKIRNIADNRGIDIAEFSTAWVLSNPNVSSVIAGPRTIEQWRAYSNSARHEISLEDIEKINAIVPPGTTAIPNYIDPAYPVEGINPLG